MRRHVIVLIAFAVLLVGGRAFAAPDEDDILRILPEIEAIIVKEDLIDALRRANADHADLTRNDIDKMVETWRWEARTTDRRLMPSVTESPLAGRMRRVMADGGDLIDEIGIIDATGLSIAQTNTVSEIWHGTDVRFAKSFRAGVAGRFIDDIEIDGPTQSIGAQANFTVADPNTGEAIGAITIHFNLDGLN